MDLVKLKEKLQHLPSDYNKKVADKFGITQQRVSQIKAIANKEEHRFNSKNVEDILFYMVELSNENKAILEERGLA